MEAFIDRNQEENTSPQKDTTPALQPEKSTATKGIADTEPVKKMEPKRIRAYESQYDRWQ